MKKKYKHISLRKELIDLIDEEIKDGKLGFDSRASFVSYLIRLYFDGRVISEK